jgi:hypothetical protein
MQTREILSAIALRQTLFGQLDQSGINKGEEKAIYIEI